MKNIWPGFSSVCHPSHKLIERAGETPSWTCTQLVGEMTRHHDIEMPFLSADS